MSASDLDELAERLYRHATSPPRVSIFDLHPDWDQLDDEDRQPYRDMAAGRNLDDLRALATEMTLDEFQRAINDMLATGMHTDFDAAWADEDERDQP